MFLSLKQCETGAVTDSIQVNLETELVTVSRWVLVTVLDDSAIVDDVDTNGKNWSIV